MNIDVKRILLLSMIFLIFSCNSPQSNENTIISIKTTQGEIKIKLYNGTPIHRDNFIKLINMSFYDGISFHRVIKDFMIQAGDPITKSGSGIYIPDSMNTYSIPSEFRPQYFHKKGALAAAREGNDINPEMRSSGTQFYIVQGVKFNDSELIQAEQRINSNIKQGVFNNFIKQAADSANLSGKNATDAEIQEIASMKMFQYLTDYKDYRIPGDQRDVYASIGGVPRLDGTYTVFGEVIEGLDVVDKIAAVPTDSNDKPLTDIKILKIKIVKN
ncbi:MAG: peptidylprolyl isomerase [Bacteroidetes bacterium]|nr:MAG: peptidylprolyl isomerase [Bacteroidota bacterium]